MCVHVGKPWLSRYGAASLPSRVRPNASSPPPEPGKNPSRWIGRRDQVEVRAAQRELRRSATRLKQPARELEPGMGDGSLLEQVRMMKAQRCERVGMALEEQADGADHDPRGVLEDDD